MEESAANKTNQKAFLKLKDYAVSGEDFKLIVNPQYGFLETRPQPPINDLPYYYKSDNYISHTDSKRNVFEKAYHLIRRISLKKKLKLIKSFSKQTKSLLDIGCGTGDFLQLAQNNKWTVFGIEPNESARNIANNKTNNAVFDLEQLLKFPEHSFDVITLWHVLEHLPNLENQIERFKKLLKHDGVLIIAVPNYTSFDASYYKHFWAAYDVPRHLWHFNKASITKLMTKLAMHVITIKPMWFDAFYVSLLSEQYKNGNMNFIKGFWIGLISNIKAINTKAYSSLIYIIKNTK